jgi:hypothetical protein
VKNRTPKPNTPNIEGIEKGAKEREKKIQKDTERYRKIQKDTKR